MIRSSPDNGTTPDTARPSGPVNDPDPSTKTDHDVPLVVDLDRVLVRTDLLVESLMVLAKSRPARLLAALSSLAGGPAHFKHRLAQEVIPDVVTLPFDEDFLDFLGQQKAAGRPLVLVTAADLRLAEAVAAHTGLFDEVICSDGINNVNARIKRDRLVARFGERGFDYAGNATRDPEVWAVARRAVLVGAAPHHADDVVDAARVERAFANRPGGTAGYLHALRPSQWIKNVLIFLPLLTVVDAVDWGMLVEGLAALVAFSLCASSGYVLNDLLDLPSDRRHPAKKNRPITSGRVSLVTMLALVPLLFLSGVVLGSWLNPWFAALLVFYCALALAYSLRLKDVAILDVLVLVTLYILRVLGGGIVFGVTVSVWLLTFCIFLFLSLGLVKRYAELVVMRSVDGSRAHARGYVLSDQEMLASLGAASGYLAGLLLVLFQGGADGSAGIVNMDPAGAVICLLFIYWVSHIWLMAHRGRMKDDPLAFAVHDRLSQALILLAAAAFATNWLV